MSKGFVLLGDKTTHGGAVISASSTMIVNGKPVALVGDKVSCPIPGHGTKEGANKQVISSQADSLIKISRIWAD
uniref:PAAR domain-containing protein n=1 Tax=Klebsiella pneumoniae TaxID=573 RepID=UPI002243B0A3